MHTINNRSDTVDNRCARDPPILTTHVISAEPRLPTAPWWPDTLTRTRPQSNQPCTTQGMKTTTMMWQSQTPSLLGEGQHSHTRKHSPQRSHTEGASYISHKSVLLCSVTPSSSEAVFIRRLAAVPPLHAPPRSSRLRPSPARI